MSKIDQIIAAGENLATSFIEARAARGVRTSLSIVASHLEENFDEVFNFDKANVGSYLTAFPDVWKSELVKDLETTLRRSVSSSLQRTILQNINASLMHDVLSEIESTQRFPAAVVFNVDRVVELVRKIGYAPVPTAKTIEQAYDREPQGIDALAKTARLLCLRILQSNEPNDYRLLMLNLSKISVYVSKMPASGKVEELLASTDELASCADLIARGVVPLPIVDQQWQDERQRVETERNDAAERKAAAERERIAAPAKAYLEAFRDRYGMTALDFIAVKESLQDKYGMRPGAITQVMLDHFALEYRLWEDGFKTVSTKVNGAIKAAGTYKGALLTREDLDPLVNASLGATIGLKSLEHAPVVRNPEDVNARRL